MKIAEYVFNTEIDTLPIFNADFKYTYSDTINEDGTTTRIIESNIRPTLIDFSFKTGLIRINELDTSKVTSCYAMFRSCTNLVYVKITNVTESRELQGMFMDCSNLETIEGMELWDTSKNESCAAMFSGCKKIKNINVSNFNMVKVQAIGAMFRSCYELTDIDLSKWQTPNVQYLAGVFTDCRALTKLDVSSFNTECFGQAGQFASLCTNLKEVNLSNWVLNEKNSIRLDSSSNSLVITYFFYKTNNVNKLIMENTDYFTVNKIIETLPTRTTSNPGLIILSMEEELDDALRTKASKKYWNIEYEQKPHEYVIAAYKFDATKANLIPSFNKEFTDYTYEDTQVQNYTQRIIKSTQLPTKIKFGTEDLSAKESSSLICLTQCATKELDDCANMFKNCNNLTDTLFYLFDNYKVKNFYSMYEGCSKFDMLVRFLCENEVEDVRNMFKGCSSLWNASLYDLKITENTLVEGIFKNCSSLRTLTNYPLSINCLAKELPQKSLYNYGEILFKDSSEGLNCSEDLTQRHWYADDVNNKVDLFVMMGQSNMEGQSETYKTFDVPDYQSCTHLFLKNEFSQVRHPFGENINVLGNPYELGYYQLEGCVGCETGLPYGSLSPHFASKYYETTKIPTLLTQCTCGATTVAEWLPGHKHGRYDLVVDKINKSVNAIESELSRNVRGKYLVWLQGESDGIYRTGTTKYKERFLQLWNKLKEDCGLEKCFIIRVAKFRPNKYNDKPIIEAQEQLALENDDIFMVTRITGYLEHPDENPENPTIQDGVTEGYPYVDHYTWEGYKLVGETAGERIGAYINTGIMPTLEDEPYVGEITSSSEMIITEYKFDNTIYENYIPQFNEGFTYRCFDTVADNITTRKIIASSLPTVIRFGGHYTYDEIEDGTTATPREQCLLEVKSINMEGVTDVTCMFCWCENLTSIPSLSFSNVTSVYSMFYRCKSLEYIDMKNYDLSQVTNAENFVWNCPNLKLIDATGINLSNVENMFTMFIGSNSLTEIRGYEDWNTQSATCMTSLFYQCNKFTDLNLSNWSVDNVTSTWMMFKGCVGLVNLDLSNWNLSSCNEFSDMFDGCNSLSKVIIKNSDYTTVNKIISVLPTKTESNPGTLILDGLDNVPELDKTTANSKHWNIIEYKIVEYKFNSEVLPIFNEGYSYDYSDTQDENGNTIRTITGVGIPTSITFANSTSLLEVLDIDISETEDCYTMFENCTSLTSVTLGNKPTPKLQSMERMFNKCSKLVNIDFGGLTTENLKFLSATFSDCTSLETLDIGNWNAEKIEALSATFRRCSKLKNLDLSKWNCKNLMYLSGTFANCSNLTQLDISKWDTRNVNTINQCFYGCSKLTSLDLNGWLIAQECDFAYAFGNCTSLSLLDISNFHIIGTKTSKMFQSADKLEIIGMLYCDKDTCEKVRSLLSNIENLQRNIYVYDTNASRYTSDIYVLFKKYNKQVIEIRLPQQLKVNDKLYWDESKNRYCINSDGQIIETNITNKIPIRLHNPYTKITTSNNVEPANITIRIAKE